MKYVLVVLWLTYSDGGIDPIRMEQAFSDLSRCHSTAVAIQKIMPQITMRQFIAECFVRKAEQ